MLVDAVKKSIRSKFGPPSLVDAVILMILFPGTHVVSTYSVFHASHDAVEEKVTVPTLTPFTFKVQDLGRSEPVE